MKKSLYFSSLLLSLLLLISCSRISARPMATKQAQDEVNPNRITSGGSLGELELSGSMNQLMDLEDCNKGDEECLERRMLSEVHLDYIYTQHHKP